MMNYTETMDYLYAHLPMFSRVGAAAYKEDLDNTIALCNALDNPHRQFKTIHIAGTNGKGSTSHMLAAILQRAGYRTGLYTSPHLRDFRERIRINGAMIDENFIVEFVARTKNLSEEIQPSFFELTVAMAFDYFAKERVDVAVIETGLGGRLDSTNVITPILSIITNIGYDHMNILGDTLEKIAFEKAGIIKPGVPVVIGEYLPETKHIFEKKAAASSAPLHYASDEYEVSDIRPAAGQLHCKVMHLASQNQESFLLDLGGLYQTRNLRTVLCAEGILTEQGFRIKNEQEKYALAHVKELTGLSGRWEQVSEKPLLVMDVAHNADGIKQVLEQVAYYRETVNADNHIDGLHFVIGLVKDKEVSAVLQLLPVTASYYFTQAYIPRALPAAELQSKAAAVGLQGAVFDDVNEAIEAALAQAHTNDGIIVCGSVFLVGEVDDARFR